MPTNAAGRTGLEADGRTLGKPGRARTVARILASLLTGSLVLLALEISRRAFRRRQLFAPSREPLISWNPSDYGIPAEAVHELEIRPDGRRALHGWYCSARQPVASVLFFHGNAGNLTSTAHMIPPLLGIGVNVLMFDYAGFGRSAGRPDVGRVLEDGLAAARMHDTLRPATLPSIAWGFSLGGAIAAEIATRFRFDALILQSTFTSLRAMARLLFPKLAVHRLSGNVLDTTGSLRRLELPLLLIHGGADEVVPHAMSRQIFEEYGGPKTMHIFEGRVHKDLFQPARAEVIETIREFVLSLPARRTEGARAHSIT
jgi:alpha-beta hydrolase superfamily lysophospholipase